MVLSNAAWSEYFVHEICKLVGSTFKSSKGFFGREGQLFWVLAWRCECLRLSAPLGTDFVAGVLFIVEARVMTRKEIARERQFPMEQRV
jgi:hypothetical protein